MKYKHIIWDWNGTLVDDTWLFVDIMNGVLKNRNLDGITLDDYRNVFDFPVQDYYKKLGFNFDDEPFESAGLDFIKIYDDRKFEPKLFDDTMPTLNKLKESGCTHSVLSAQNIVTLKKSVSHYQLDQMFEYISGLEDHYAIGKVEQGKNLIQNLDFQLDEVAMIGDTEHDHEVAEAMGIKCFLMDRGHNSTNRLKSKTSKVLSSFTELMEEIS